MSDPRPVWFCEGPGPQQDRTGHSGSTARLAIENGNVWGVEQTPILPQQLDRVVEFASMPHALLHSLVHRADVAGAVLPEPLRRNVLERDEPVELTVAMGELRHLAVAGSHLMAYRLEYGSYQSLITVFDDAWLAVLCPFNVDATLRHLPLTNVA